MGCVQSQKKVPKLEQEERLKFTAIDVDPECYSLPYYSLSGKIITYKGSFDEYPEKTQILWKTPFAKKRQFNVKIINSDLNARQWWIGAIDSKQKNVRWTNQFDPAKTNWFGYRSDGYVVGGGQSKLKKQGGGFRKGDNLRVIMDVEKGTISWKINGIEQAKQSSQLISSSKIEWVPCWMLIQVGYALQYLN